MYPDDLAMMLAFCFAVIMGIASLIAYAIGNLRKRVNQLDTELRQVLFKLRLWDTLIYGDDDANLTTGDNPPPPVRRGNVVYLTPPDDE